MNDKTWQMISKIPEPPSTWTDSMDIRDFIRTLPDTEQSMCWMLVVDGVSQARVARRFKVTPEALTQMVRNALEPLCQAFDIPVPTHADDPFSPDFDWEWTPSGTVKETGEWDG